MVANRGYEINEAFHYKLTLEPVAGDFAVHGRLEFAVCKHESQCLPKSMPVTVLVAAR